MSPLLIVDCLPGTDNNQPKIRIDRENHVPEINSLPLTLETQGNGSKYHETTGVVGEVFYENWWKRC